MKKMTNSDGNDKKNSDNDIFYNNGNVNDNDNDAIDNNP